MSRYVLCLLVLAVAAIGATVCDGASKPATKPGEDVVARLGGVPITRDDFVSFLMDVDNGMGLRLCIEHVLVEEAARRRNAEITDERLRERLAAMERVPGDVEDRDAYVEARVQEAWQDRQFVEQLRAETQLRELARLDNGLDRLEDVSQEEIQETLREIRSSANVQQDRSKLPEGVYALAGTKLLRADTLYGFYRDRLLAPWQLEERLKRLLAMIAARSELDARKVELTEADAEYYVGLIQGTPYAARVRAAGGGIEGIRAYPEIEAEARLVKLLRKDVAERDLRQFFYENVDLYSGKEVRARHILIAVEGDSQPALDRAWKKAEELRSELDKGAAFNELVREDSDDPDKAYGKGDLGYFGRYDKEEPIAAAAFSMRVGQVAGPIETADGLHLIEIIDIRPGREVTLEEVRQDVESKVLQERMQEWVADVLESVDVEVYL